MRLATPELGSTRMIHCNSCKGVTRHDLAYVHPREVTRLLTPDMSLRNLFPLRIWSIGFGSVEVVTLVL